MTLDGKRLILLAALAVSAACSPTGSGQIPCVDDSSCPSEFPVCSGAGGGKKGTCIAGDVAAPSIEIVGVEGHVESDVIGNHAVVVVDATARAASGIDASTVTLTAGTKTYHSSATSKAPLFSFDVPTDDLVTGPFALKASFTAGDGTAVTSQKPYTLHVDNVAPAVTPGAPTPAAANSGTLVSLDVTASKGLDTLTADVSNSSGGSEGEMSEIVPPTGLVHHLAFPVTKDVDDTYTVKLTPKDTAGNTGAQTSATFAVSRLPSFGPRQFSVTWSASGTSAITAGSLAAHGTYTFTIPQVMAAGGTANITDSNGISYSDSASIKTAAAGTGLLSGVAISPASVSAAGTLAFTLTIRNTATTAATRTAMATLTVVAAPAVSSFSMSPTIVTDGSAATVMFAASAGSAILSGTGAISFPETKVVTGGAVVVPYGQTTTFSLKVINGVGDPAGSVTFASTKAVQSVAPPSASLSLTSASSFTASTIPSFSYSVAGGACSVGGNCAIRTTDCSGTSVVDIPADGSATATAPSINATTNYLLCVKNAATSAATALTPAIAVTKVAAPGAYTFAMKAGSTTVPLSAAGNVTFVLSPASIPNAVSAVITGNGQSTGNILGSANPMLPAPTATTTYTLTVKNGAGDALGTSTATAIVLVGEAVGQSVMTTPRLGAAAVRLPDGRVLITGGSTDTTVANGVITATIFDANTGAFSDGATGTTFNMQVARAFHTATLISANTTPPFLVFVAGGTTSGTTAEIITVNARGTLASSTASSTLQGDSSNHRCFHNATLVPGTVDPNARVLMTGGSNCAGSSTVANSVELWIQNPASSVIQSAALTSAHVSGTATLLPDNSLLVAGGGNSKAQRKLPPIDGSGAWNSEVTMMGVRTGHTATLIGSNVLVVGGAPTPSTVTGTAEIYNSGTGAFGVTGGTGLITARADHAAARLPSGLVLILGGDDRNLTQFSSVEFYDPAPDKFFPGPSLLNPRQQFVALSSASGSLLIAGGAAAATPTESLILP